MNASSCWICGSPADSAEHMVKASDFRSVFGRVTHKAPAYRHSRGDANHPIRGVDVSAIKFRPSLCQRCNNARTQTHDRSWEMFLAFVRSFRPKLRKGDRVPFSRIFRGNVESSALALHMYFLKQLGCHSVENGVPLPINQFASCILSNNPHPCVRLIFVSVPSDASKYKIQVGDIQTLNRAGRAVSAIWHYRVETLGVFVSYTEPEHPRLTQERGWHPHDMGVPRMA